MEIEGKCKVLSATFQEEKGFLGGPHKIEFNICHPSSIHVLIEQIGVRKITIISESEITVKELYKIFSRVEKLLMLFDGKFFPLLELTFSDSDSTAQEQLMSYAHHCLNQRLSYYRSSDFCLCAKNKLVSFEKVIDADLFQKWDALIDELDVVHQVFLYALCDNGQPVDIKCAFLIELAEPLIEIIKLKKHYFSSLDPEDRKTTLKNCLDAIITKYGEDIFQEELLKNPSKFLQVLVNSRVRIMHIKRNQKGYYFNAVESVAYSAKIYLMYRRIIFELLNINESEYLDNLHNSVRYWNQWNDVVKRFLNKLN